MSVAVTPGPGVSGTLISAPAGFCAPVVVAEHPVTRTAVTRDRENAVRRTNLIGGSLGRWDQRHQNNRPHGHFGYSVVTVQRSVSVYGGVHCCSSQACTRTSMAS